jgi:hypothetical protein
MAMTMRLSRLNHIKIADSYFKTWEEISGATRGEAEHVY